MAEDRMLSDEVLLALIKKNSGGGGGGTDDYNDLKNQPKINNNTLVGNKTASDLGLATENALANKVDKVEGKGLSTNDFTDTEKAQVATNTEDIDSLKSGLTNLSEEVNGDATVYPYADAITIEDAVPSNLADCKVKIEPVQDLHGYDKPWVGGAGKNKLPLTVDIAKSLNGGGTWTGNTYNFRDVDFTLNTDSNGNVTSVKVNGTASQNVTLLLDFVGTASTEYYIGGCPTNGGNNTFYFDTFGDDVARAADLGSGATFTADGNSQYVRIGVQQGYNAQNLMFYPMICLNSETDKSFAPYTNICPISGSTESVVTRTGKNECDFADKTKDSYGYFVGSAQETEYINSNHSVLKAGRYTFSCKYKDITNGSSTQLLLYSKGSSVTSYSKTWSNMLSSGTLSYTFNVTDNIEKARVYCNSPSGGTFYDFQLELGSTATPYEPYQGKTYTISLGDTIYGGTVDFDSGVMTVDSQHILINSASQITANNASQFYVNQSTASGFEQGKNVISDKFKSIASSTGDGCFINSAGLIRFNTVTEYESASALIADLTSIQFVAKLATPTTIQLTPQQIQLLKGTNTITASTGDISVNVNGVNGSIGAVQEQVNGLAEDVAECSTVQTITQAPTFTENVTGGIVSVRRMGSLVIVSLEYTPVADTIVSFKQVITGLPSPVHVMKLFDGYTQIELNSQGVIQYYYPSNTTTLTRRSYTFCYFAR